MTLQQRLLMLKLTLNWFTEFALEQVLLSVVEAVAIIFLWNNSIPDIFPGFKQISYPQAFMLVLLCKIFSRSWTQNLQQARLTNITLGLNTATGYLYHIYNFLANTVVIDKIPSPTDEIKPEEKQ